MKKIMLKAYKTVFLLFKTLSKDQKGSKLSQKWNKY